MPCAVAARRDTGVPMTRAEKAARIRAILDELYPEVPIPLAHRDAFTLLVAVVLSAQCTDARVNQVTPALFKRAGTPRAMARLSEAEILGLIRSCGLAPSKAKHLKGLAECLVRAHGGRVPADLAALEALPGVGHKTASVVLSQAFGQPAFPVDTHIHRLAARWGLSDGRSVERTERDLKRLFPPESWNRLHLQIIYFGRQYCPARGHDVSRCPICSWAASAARAHRVRRRGARPAQG
jgi:endonuclease-3